MALDAWVRKYFGLLVLALIALAAWLSARGVTALVGARIGAGDGARSSVVGGAVLAPASAAPDAASILARNPFDSVTGPLGRAAVEESAPPEDLGHAEPLTAPPCADLELRIVTEADDPRQSRAALQAKGEESARVVGVGERLGDRRVAYIGFNPALGSPAVWLTDEGGLCQALLFASADGGAIDLAPPVAPPPRHDLAAVIHKQSDTRITIDRSAVASILSDGRKLMPDSAILFEQSGGKVLGVRVFKIAPDSLLAHLGIESGDRIESVNGVAVTSRAKALEGYQGLRGGGPVEIQVLRKGKRVGIELEVR